VSFRTYREVPGDDRSGLGRQVAAQRARVAERLRDVGCVVAVLSGKGGVGKTWVSVALACGLAERGHGDIGLLDADLKSPTAARLLEAGGPLRVDETGVHPAVGASGVRVMSTDLLLEDGAPLAWRGPDAERFLVREILETGTLREFLADVAWGPLAVLVVDMPPDGDRIEDLLALVPELGGVLAVTIPSDESRRSVIRALHCARDAGAPLLGLVENMSGYACADCGTVGPLFAGDAGVSLARQFDIPLLCRIPFMPGAHPADVPSLSTRLADAVLGALQ
jgi:ATP-binding protein involved in chromosome partitioning